MHEPLPHHYTLCILRTSCTRPHPLPHPFPHLPNKVCAEHDDIGVFGEALSGCQVANPLAGEAGVAHHFNDVEGCPTDVVAQHLELQTREGTEGRRGRGEGGEGKGRGRGGEGEREGRGGEGKGRGRGGEGRGRGEGGEGRGGEGEREGRGKGRRDKEGGEGRGRGEGKEGGIRKEGRGEGGEREGRGKGRRDKEGGEGRGGEGGGRGGGEGGEGALKPSLDAETYISTLKYKPCQVSFPAIQTQEAASHSRRSAWTLRWL